ncbi:RteC domain-containing protein [Pedobacter insulae]|uniref:RteC protein n=1 Tax=Pedobacter insulae TaxID=414048 RepID=A0A1I2ZL18_9SPHI|nr:RteC domain-containing protein [Pedobacter insulae]SFH37811.1 RteC protein [Pedobacter insulae]
MIHFTSQLYDQMEQELNLLAMVTGREAFKAKACFEIVEATLSKLKEFIRSYEFKDISEEVLFFKEIKPGFHHLLIYYEELAFIESNKPQGDRKVIIAYYRKAIDRNSDFMERHKILHVYHALGHTCEDDKWFLRNVNHPSFYPECDVDMDAMFSTKSSAVLSKLLGFEKLNGWLATIIEQLKSGAELLPVKPDIKGTNLLWTDSKAALVELAYALLARGSANYGKADLNQIMKALEIAFNVQAGNYYRTFTDLSNRKKGRTPFLDSLKENLERRMDERL